MSSESNHALKSFKIQDTVSVVILSSFVILMLILTIGLAGASRGFTLPMPPALPIMLGIPGGFLALGLVCLAIEYHISNNRTFQTMKPPPNLIDFDATL